MFKITPRITPLILSVAVATMPLIGCATMRNRALDKELRLIVTEAVRNNASCTTLCIKLKEWVGKKMGSMK